MTTSSGGVSERTLTRALESGLLSGDQLAALHALERGETTTIVFDSRDDEQFRFIRGFGDIFVTIGLILFLGAVGYFGGTVAESFGAFGATSIASWALAEYFTRIRRMALPSIVLLLVFTYSVYGVAGAAIAQLGGYPPEWASIWFRQSAPPTILIGGGLAAAVGAALHYWRFRVPITIAAGVGALVAIVAGLVSAMTLAPRPVLLATGVAVFALAMRYDLSDPRRVTRRTDIAFWLHMLAAPLIVHTLIGNFFDGAAPGITAALGILAVFVALAIVALIVDRRAVLVSGLSYAGIAFGTLVAEAGISGQVPLTLLVLGSLVLILSAGWHGMRRFLLGLLPEHLSRRLSLHTSDN